MADEIARLRPSQDIFTQQFHGKMCVVVPQTRVTRRGLDRVAGAAPPAASPAMHIASARFRSPEARWCRTRGATSLTAASGGQHSKAPGFAGGYLLRRKYPRAAVHRLPYIPITRSVTAAASLPISHEGLSRSGMSYISKSIAHTSSDRRRQKAMTRRLTSTMASSTRGYPVGRSRPFSSQS